MFLTCWWRLIFRLATSSSLEEGKSTVTVAPTKLAEAQETEGHTGTSVTPNVTKCSPRTKSTCPSIDFITPVTINNLACSNDIPSTVLSSEPLTSPYRLPMLIMFLLDQAEGWRPKILMHTSLKGDQTSMLHLLKSEQKEDTGCTPPERELHSWLQRSKMSPKTAWDLVHECQRCHPMQPWQTHKGAQHLKILW